MKFNPTYFFLLFYTSIFGQQNVLITDNTTQNPDASSLLELNTSSKGLLIPRVALQNTADGITISSPAHSLLVYNTNASMTNGAGLGYYYNEGTTLAPQWVRLFASNSAGGEWKLLGNAGTNATNNFIGTTDAVDFVVRTNSDERMRVLSTGNVGIGEVNPSDRLHVSNGNLRVGELSTTPGPAGYGRRLFFSGGNSFLGNSDNTDAIYFSRYNVANDVSELRLIIGDNNSYNSAAVDRFYIGNEEGGTFYPKAEFRSDGKLTISRDGVGECCGNDATFAIGENTTITGRRPSISFHASGESEGSIHLTADNMSYSGLGLLPGTSYRRIRFFDNQGQGLGIETSGNLWFGNANSRTQTRDNAGLQGNAGAQSGFYETSNPSNFPSGASSWWHLIDSRHSNSGNNYAMQFSGSFSDQDIYSRKTNNNASQSWARVQTSRDIATAKIWGTNSYNNNDDWRNATGWTNYIDVKVGDILKFDYSFVARLTQGSSNDDFYYYIEFDGCVGGNELGTSTWLRPAERSEEHDNNRPYTFVNFWNSNCNGQLRFRLWVQNEGDDNWEMHNRVLIVTRY